MKDKQHLHQNDIKKGSHQNSSSPFLSNPKPEFMNDLFCTFLKLINFLTGAYILLSFILYFVNHSHGKDLFKSKKSYSEYDQLLFMNLYYDVFLAFAMVVSYISICKKSVLLFSGYWGLMITALVIGFYGTSHLETTLTSKIRYVLLSLFGLNVLFVLYLVFHYLRKIQYFRVSLENLPVDNILHEIKLRTDMMKIGFNHMVIKMKLHKIFPNITFKKEDYYFLSEECRLRSSYKPVINKEDDDCCNVKSNQFVSGSTADDAGKVNNLRSMKSS